MKLLSIFLFFLSVGCLSGSEMDTNISKTSREIGSFLISACEFSKSASYMATHEVTYTFIGNKFVCNAKTYRYHGTGDKMLERREFIKDNKNFYTQIAGDLGYYEIINPESAERVIIKNKSKLKHLNKALSWGEVYLYPPKFASLNIPLTLKKDVSTYKNIPCYCVTTEMPIPEKNEFLPKFGISSPEKMTKKDYEEWTAVFPCVKEYLIAKDDARPFIYQVKYYNSKGRVIFTEDFGIPDYNVNIRHNLFDPPQGKVQTIKTERDMEVLLKKLNEANNKIN